ncbi:MAG TPA: thioesterase family protein [Candidatus Dormibacteraeota bacterium]|nr:thioesterase family protein [Candidatus Dormibacteraeota bacterium]
MSVNKRTIHIEWGDCDPAGIVYFPRYFEFFDACTHALFASVGLPKQEMLVKYSIAGIPLVESRARFLVPSSFGDAVVVESRVTQWGRSSFSVEHKLFKKQELAVEGFEKRVWAIRVPGSAKKLQSQAIPREVIEKF